MGCFAKGSKMGYMTMFWPKDFRDDDDRIIKYFFNSIYDHNKFMYAMKLVVNKTGCVINEDYCLFPDFVDADPSGHFEGVMFGGMFEETTVSEEKCHRYVDLDCERYVEMHPGEADKMSDLLKGRQF